MAWMVTYSCPSWCRPCKNFRPVQKQIANLLANHSGHVRIAHVECDRNRRFCDQQGIRSYPTVNLYLPGEHRPQQMNVEDAATMAGQLRDMVGVPDGDAVAGSEEEDMFDHDEF